MELFPSAAFRHTPAQYEGVKTVEQEFVIGFVPESNSRELFKALWFKA